jgi:glycosyltransferase involved in cell wall biosynthesis
VAHVTVHHVPPELAISPHRRVLQAAVARRIDCTIAVTSAQLPNMAWLGFRPESTRVILNGVAAPRVSRDRSETRAELGLCEQEFVALFAARLRPEKRVGVFIAAVEAAHAIDPRIRGIVAGAGDDLEAARAQAAASGCVTVLGQRTDVPDLMVASDVVCLPSEAEALPMVIIEAMAVGRPVIATNVGGVADVLLDGVTGIIVDLDQGETLTRALVTLAADPDAARGMGAAGRREFEERFTLEAMADRYAETLHEFAGRRAAGSRAGR